jgi:hypothetical protein
LNLDNCGRLKAEGNSSKADSKELEKLVKTNLPKLKVLSLHGVDQPQLSSRITSF